MKKCRFLSILLISLLITGLFTPHVQASTKLSRTTATIYVGETLQLKISGTKSKATWSTSNKKIATVSSNGKVYAKSKGEATITAKINNKKYTCKISVIRIKDKIDITYKKYKNGILAFVKNKNKFTISLDGEMYYYMKGELVDTHEENIRSLGSGKTAVLMFILPYDEKTYNNLQFDKFKLDYSVKHDDDWYIDHTDEIDMKYEKMISGDIHCTLKNNGKSKLYYTEYCVVFYKNGKVVDYDYSNELCFEPKKKITSNISTYEEYDTFEVYLNCAYTLT